MKKLVFLAASLAIASATHAQTAFKPPVIYPLSGTHCEQGHGPIPPMSYDPSGHPMQCGQDGTWAFIPEGDADRITRKLDQLNTTDTQILVTLTQLLAVQQANVQK